MNRTDSLSGLAEAAVNELPFEVAILDDSGTIVYTNERWQTFACENGSGDPTFVGVDYLAVSESATDEGAQDAAAGIRAVLEGDQSSFSLEYPCHSPTERRWFRLTAAGFDFQGDRYAYVGHFDITDRRLAEAAVATRNERLEAVASVLSHDIRNPLSVVLGYTDDLDADRIDPDVRDHIRSAAERAETIIDDALVIASNRPVESTEVVDLEGAARDAWSNVATDDAVLDVAFSQSRAILADRGLLGNLLENLFRNAIEHAGPDVRVTVTPLADGFAVSDDGPGIDPSVRDRVFTAGVSGGDGTGLGLMVVQSVCEAHGWSVSLDEDSGSASGARFQVTGVKTR